MKVIEATFRRLEHQSAEDSKQHRQREHTLEMLQMDKAYLTKQVEFVHEQQRKTQAELEMREGQLTELQRSRNELYEKLMQAESGRARHDEARLHKELAQLQVRRRRATLRARFFFSSALCDYTVHHLSTRLRLMRTWSGSRWRWPRRTSGRPVC